MFALYCKKKRDKNKIHAGKKRKNEVSNFRDNTIRFYFHVLNSLNGLYIVCGASKSRHAFMLRTKIHWQSVKPGKKVVILYVRM